MSNNNGGTETGGTGGGNEKASYLVVGLSIPQSQGTNTSSNLNTM